jgi:hypothetical protein
MARRFFLAPGLGTRSSRSRRRTPRAGRARELPIERLESRLALAADLLSIAAARPGAVGFPEYPALPIPAGATLVDVSDSGKQVLFSSADPNIVPGQQTVPFLEGAVGNLFWMDLSAGLDAPVIRLVTHVAGSTQASAGFTGIGTGLVNPFVPGTADLSGDGMSVVFDSAINAHTFDATVPVANDQPSNAKLVVTLLPGQSAQAVTVEGEGSIDVFVWHAAAPDPANNIVAVSLLNAAGKQAAVGQAAQWGFTTPDVTRPMMTGVFPEQPPLGFSFGFQVLEPTPSTTGNNGISADGRRILYSSDVPAPWLDTVNTSPVIVDDVDPLVGPGWSVDGFVVDRADLGSAAALEASGRTLTATKYQDGAGPRALGSYQNAVTWLTGFLPSATFYPEYLQLSAQGNRVVYSTRVPSSTPVPGTTDSTFSLDVFAYDVASDANILVTTAAGQPTVAAGAGQGAFPEPQPGQTFGSLDLFDSQNHAVSGDGTTIAVTSSAGNLIAGFVDNNVTLRPVGVIGVIGSPFTVLVRQQAAIDVYAVRPDTRTAFLVNTPNGLANTNHNASFGGMSADGSTFLFGTIANNFYNPAFGNPPYPPFATGPLPPNFLLGGFEHLWSRQVDQGTTTLVSVGWQNDASGNRPTTVTPVAPGARDVLPNVSETGRFVMFATASNNIVPGIADRTFKGGVYVRDMQTGVATLVSTTATGNFPSAGTFAEYAVAADDAAGTARFFLGGVGGGDMQARFRPEDLPGAGVAPPAPQIYALDYPITTPAASATNRDVFSVSGAGTFGRTVVEYRGVEGTVKASPATLLPGFAGEWRTATGDVTGDGVADYVYGAGPGGRDTVIVVDGRSNAVVMQFRAFPNLPVGGGVFVATGDVNRDGFADVIAGSDGSRAAQVIVVSGRRGEVLRQFLPFGNGKAVVVAARVAGGDVDGDGFADVVVATGPGRSPRAEVYSGKLLVRNTNAVQARIASFALAAGTGRNQAGNGVFVAAADMTGDGKAEVIASFDGRPTVSVINGLTGRVLSAVNLATLPGAGPAFAKGVRVAARANRIAIVTGPGSQPALRILAFRNLAWSVSPLKSPALGATGTKGLYIG